MALDIEKIKKGLQKAIDELTEDKIDKFYEEEYRGFNNTASYTVELGTIESAGSMEHISRHDSENNSKAA